MRPWAADSAPVSLGFAESFLGLLDSIEKRHRLCLMDNYLMGNRRIPPEAGNAAMADLANQLPTAVRFSLQRIEDRYRGGSVELRVPPFGAIQCIQGQEHRRGTPPNVVEMAPEVFIALCLKETTFPQEVLAGRISLSGVMAAEVAVVFD
jgi:hypothetical protein